MDAAREVENEFDPETVMIKKTSKEFSHMKDSLLWSSVAVSGRITVKSNRENGSDLILLQNGSISLRKSGWGLFWALCMCWMMTKGSGVSGMPRWMHGSKLSATIH